MNILFWIGGIAIVSGFIGFLIGQAVTLSIIFNIKEEPQEGMPLC